MAANKQVRFGPTALTTTTTTNILNPGTTTGGTGMPSNSGNLYFILTHIRILNKTTSPQQVALWMSTTGDNSAGKEFAFGGIASAGALTDGVSVAAQSYVDWYGAVRMDAADFLVGGASAATSLTFNAEGEIGVN